MQKLRSKGNKQSRQRLIREAARLMYEEHVNQYYDAKRMAAKRILGHGAARMIRFRPQDLPSNGEIAMELDRLADFHEGESRLKRLFTMRLTALDVMQELHQFEPRLIGSVSTGRIRATSDIDLHVFCDSMEELENHLLGLNWSYQTKQITIQKSGSFFEYTHIYMEREFPIELSVYPYHDLRIQSRSSTDGKWIVRLKIHALLQLIMDEHADEWRRYLQSGVIEQAGGTAG